MFFGMIIAKTKYFTQAFQKQVPMYCLAFLKRLADPFPAFLKGSADSSLTFRGVGGLFQLCFYLSVEGRRINFRVFLCCIGFDFGKYVKTDAF